MHLLITYHIHISSSWGKSLRYVHAWSVPLQELIEIYNILVMLTLIGMVHHYIAVAPTLEKGLAILVMSLPRGKKGYFTLVNRRQTAV